MGKWTKSEVRRLIVEALVPVLESAGFRYRKSAEGFVRKIDGGRQEIGIALWDFAPLFEFTLTLCVRLDQIQDLVNRFSGSPPQYHGITLTSITQLEFLGLPANPQSGMVKYLVTSESELAAVLPGVVAMVQDRVLPFFAEYTDIPSLNRGLNPAGAEHVTQEVWPPDRSAFDSSNMPYRAMAGLAVAHFAGDPRLIALAAAYRAQVSGMQDQERQKLESLVAFLLGTNDAEHDTAPITELKRPVR
jgi:hypothetical protein